MSVCGEPELDPLSGASPRFHEEAHLGLAVELGHEAKELFAFGWQRADTSTSARTGMERVNLRSEAKLPAHATRNPPRLERLDHSGGILGCGRCFAEQKSSEGARLERIVYSGAARVN